MKLYQALLQYLGLDAETKRMRLEVQKNFEMAEEQLSRIQRRLQETSTISASGKRALHKTLSESDFGQRRAASGR